MKINILKKPYKISIIIGTRPEAIKLASLIISFKKNKTFKTRIILTGQHKEMVTQVMNIFNLKSDINFEIMKENQSLDEITIKIMKSLKKEFEINKPDLVIVQGDTTSSFVGALAAFYQKIPIAHLEAGLRTDNIYNPFPEEINRRLISQIATLHFAPTDTALKNLSKSRAMGEIHKTGNTVIDTLYLAVNKKSKIDIQNYGLEKNKFILCTIHRRENWGAKLESITMALQKILEINKEIKIIFPMHKNKVIRKSFIKILGNNPRAILAEPLGYIDLISIMKKSLILITDSGGLQEEAPSLGKPVVVVRETTERQESIDCGASILVGTETDNIVKGVNELINNKEKYNSMSKTINPYGDGKASERIIKICDKYLSNL